jgi:hypothetical protein
MCGKPRLWSFSAPRLYRWDIRSGRCRCLRVSEWRYQELATLTCASSVVAVALVVLELCPFVLDHLAAQARTQLLQPVIGLVTDRTVSVGHQIAFHRRCVDRFGHRVHRHVRHHDLLCLHVLTCFEEHLPVQVFPKVSRPFGWMVEFGLPAQLMPV